MTRPRPRRIAIIAGGGQLPEMVATACERQGIEVFIVALDGHADPDLIRDRAHMTARLGAAGRIIEALRSRQLTDIVMIGAVKRPRLAELRPDLKTAGFFLRLGLKALGDDGLLQSVRAELERDGFRLWGAHDFLDEALARDGVMTRCQPDVQNWSDIRHAGKIAAALGGLDIGQAVIVQDGIVVGVEAIEGTDELIRRCALYREGKKGGVLVKRIKPQQDRDLDMPTIGPQTIRNCIDAGLSGVAVEVDGCLIVDPSTVVDLADAARLFIVVTNFAHD